MTGLLNSLSWIFGRIPLRMARSLGAGMGALAFWFSSRRREVDLRISESLGVDASEARKIQRGMYRNLGWTIAEFLRMPHMTREEVRRLIRYEHTERLPDTRRGFFAVVAHTGNWELMAAGTAFEEPPVPLNLVVKRLKPDSLDRWVLKTRSCWGNTIHDRRGAYKELLRRIKNEENIAYVLDQNTKRNWGIFVDFFGKPACTSHGLAQLASVSNHRIFPIFCHRDPQTRNLIVDVGEEIPRPVDRSEAEIRRVTEACTRRLEDFIREHPDQWIWMHRRWRTQPES